MLRCPRSTLPGGQLARVPIVPRVKLKYVRWDRGAERWNERRVKRAGSDDDVDSFKHPLLSIDQEAIGSWGLAHGNDPNTAPQRCINQRRVALHEAHELTLCSKGVWFAGV